jgi:glycogen debranching enzyme
MDDDAKGQLASTDPDYHISADSSRVEKRRYTLKQGNTFAILDEYGDCDGRSREGLYHRDTRFLSHSQFSIEGKRPVLLSSDMEHNNAGLHVDLTNPDLFEGERLAVGKETVHVSRVIFLWESCRYEMIAIRNFGVSAMPFNVAIDFGVDFADLFEIRGFRRTRRGTVSISRRGDANLRFDYRSLDNRPRATEIVFAPAPQRLRDRRAEFEFQLAPGERTTILMTVRCCMQEDAREELGFLVARRRARRGARALPNVRIETSDPAANAVLERSLADLEMLVTETPQGRYPYAGIPWFSTPFGRDGLITGLETLWLAPAISRGVLRFLAAHQANSVDPENDAEPGKIVHEIRQGELAALGEIPFGRYYGSVDATPLFVVLAGRYWERTGDIATLREIWPAIKAALAWIDEYGDRNGDGFVDYGGNSQRGLANQGWKDSEDSVFHADGTLAHGPIALCEVQGYVFLARLQAAALARAMGEEGLAVRLTQQAAALRNAFEDRFWCEDIGTYALALDGRGEPCRVRTSNAGHVLFCGLAAPERAARVARQFGAANFFSGWGVRTVAAGESRFNPCSYHNGSIWPHDNALIALGLARYGERALVHRLSAAMFETANRMQLRRLPELFCGFQRRRVRGPTLYPVACSPQAWAAAAPVGLLQACLNFEFDPSGPRVLLRQPQLPASFDWMRVRGLAIGNSDVDVFLHRQGQTVVAEVAGDCALDILLP